MRALIRGSLWPLLIAGLLIVGAATGQIKIDRTGSPHARRPGKTQRPKTIIDTLRCNEGTAILVLNKHAKRNKHSTAPVKVGNIYVQSILPILSSADDTPNDYGVYISSRADSVIVRSSDADDSSKVVITILIK